jgi:DNA-binding SARP family transcriptional activator
MTTGEAAPGRPHLAVLGVPGVVGAGRPPACPPVGHARLAFALLVLDRHRPVHREELAEAVWDGDPPRTWWSALRTALAHVRGSLCRAGLPPDALRAEGGCYRLRLPPSATVDVEVARAALTQAGRLLASRAAGAAAEAAPLAEAAATTLVQPLLPGMEGEWVDAARQPLERDAVRALELLAACRAGAGDAAGTIAAADAVIARDPFRESAHLRKMAAYLALGDRAGALRAYRRCRDVLAEELGIEPGEEVERLAERAGHRRPPHRPGPAQPGPRGGPGPRPPAASPVSRAVAR